MTEDNHYLYGSNVLYEVNGDADDWMYGEQTTKEKIFSFTPELGSAVDGFWCPVNRIIPIARENMIQNIRVALFPGIYALADETGSHIIEEESGNIYFDLKRYGLEDGGIFTISLEPVSGNILSTGDPKVYTGMDLLETISDSISYTLDPFLPNGTWCDFFLTVDNGGFVLSDTISKVYGEPVTIFEDACNDMTHWWSPFWDVTTANYHSPPGSITDSPSGDYPGSSIRDVITTTGIEIPDGAMVAILNFFARWEIEEDYDFSQLLISTDGMNWTALEGNYTVASSPYQSQQPIPVYEGSQTNWVQEEIDLTDYIGNNVTLKFTLKSNDTINEDGFYFDDLSLKVIEQAVTIEEFPSGKDKGIAFEIFPNPTNELSNFRFQIAHSQYVKLIICDLHGREVMTIIDEVMSEGEHVMQFDASSLKSGVYFCLLKTEKGIQTKKLVRLE